MAPLGRYLTMLEPITLLLSVCSDCAQPVQPDFQAATVVCEPTHDDRPSFDERSACISAPESMSTASALQAEFSSRTPTLTVEGSPLGAQQTRPEALLSVSRPETSQPANSRPLLRSGSRGAAVVDLQTTLQRLGYDLGARDGVFGRLTKTAVINFQQEHDLKPDGIVGQATWAMLDRLSTSSQKPSLTMDGVNASRAETSRSGQSTTGTATRSTPSPQATPIPDEESRVFYRRGSSNSEANYLWFLGWGVFYVGGWILLSRDIAREMRGVRVAKRSPSTRNRQPSAQPNEHHEQPSHDATSIMIIDVESEPVHDAVVETAVTDAINPFHLSEDAEVLSPAIAPEATSVVSDRPIMPASDLLSVESAPMAIAEDPAMEMDVINQGYYAAEDAEYLPEMFEDDETEEPIIATLQSATAGGEKAYTYSLIDDAAGLFILRGNQLRLISQRLKHLEAQASKVITLRRTDAQGTWVDKSFKIEIQKMLQLLNPDHAMV